MIGKLKHSLKERCPQCGKILQLRETDSKSIIDGESVFISKDIICCSNKNCEYERDVEQKRRRRKEENLAL